MSKIRYEWFTTDVLWDENYLNGVLFNGMLLKDDINDVNFCYIKYTFKNNLTKHKIRI
jgi:hypothetical protein